MAINAYWHVKQGGAGLKNGTNWANAADEPAMEIFLEGAVVPGDVIFVMKGTYTLDSAIDFSARSGTAVSPIVIIGVKDTTTNVGANITYADWSRLAADRPFFDCVTFNFKSGNYFICRNISFQGEASYLVWSGIYNIFENCKFENDNGASSAEYGLLLGASGYVLNCEFTSANSRGLICGGNSGVFFNYFHDFPDAANGIGIVTNGVTISIHFNIFDNCTIGISSVSRDDCDIINNTFYETATGISETDGERWVCINNIMEGNNTAGFLWTTQTDHNFFWKNHGDDARCTDMWSLVDTTTVFQDYEVSTGDPLFTTPGADHSLQAASPNIGNGMSIELGV